ncbi:HNH endonuclease signature motif containing protein [Rhodocyclus tenuis]|uniref:HNH nuclease domain-containing protein n=1 Tax=Rhodocyclus tenuis TaxID=1066 RepID=A0A840GCH4_RHOTE|nr:HNH endonuclease signature motif containing protein [Rhodocyclus tenuis]MBB4248348.1 hypothetical protein [Rhodocyclus tenuis]
MSRHWPQEKLSRLAEIYPDQTAAACAEQLGKTVPEIYRQARALGLQKSAAFYAGPASGRRDNSPSLWVEPMRKRLIEIYPDNTAAFCAAELGVSIGQIYSAVARMGLKKSEAFKASAKSGRLDGIRGAETRFGRGQVARKKGMKGLALGSRTTQYPPGHKPFNWVPIGSERLVDGYLQRKMTDTGYPPKDWKFVHRLMWEEANGPIPAGHMLVFRDGNRAHIALDNLELITRAEHMRRHTLHNYPPELAECVLLRSQITRHINRREGK